MTFIEKKGIAMSHIISILKKLTLYLLQKTENFNLLINVCNKFMHNKHRDSTKKFDAIEH